MGVTKTTTTEGRGVKPQAGQIVVIEFTGWLKNTEEPENKGTVMTHEQDRQLSNCPEGPSLIFMNPTGGSFDSSVDKPDFEVEIGIGKVIMGWDQAVLDMEVGERATLDISSDYGYGERGFRGHIPPGADLIFEVYLKAVK